MMASHEERASAGDGFPLGRRGGCSPTRKRAAPVQGDHPAGAVLRSQTAGRAALFRDGAGRLSTLDATSICMPSDLSRARPLPCRRHVQPREARDLISMPPLTWHQFRATAERASRLPLHGECRARRPQLPSAHDIERLRSDPAVARFLDGGQTDD